MDNQKKELENIIECIEKKYSTAGKHREWMTKQEIEIAKQCLAEGKPYYLKRAQWGGKWGNYYHLITKNSKGVYQFVGGFNPHNALD